MPFGLPRPTYRTSPDPSQEMLLSLCLVLGILFRPFYDDEEALPPEIATKLPDPPSYDKSCQTDPSSVGPDTTQPPTYCHRSTQTDAPVNRDTPSLRHVACQTNASVSSTQISQSGKSTQTDPPAQSVAATASSPRKVVYCDVQTQTADNDHQGRIDRNIRHAGDVTELSSGPRRNTRERLSPSTDPLHRTDEQDPASTTESTVTHDKSHAIQSGAEFGQLETGKRKWRPRGKKGKGKAQRELKAIVEEHVEEIVLQITPAFGYDTSDVVLPRAWVRPARRHSVTETAPYGCLPPKDEQDPAPGLRRTSSASDLTCLDFGYTVPRSGSLWNHNIIMKRAIDITASTSSPTGLSSRYEVDSLGESSLVAPF